MKKIALLLALGYFGVYNAQYYPNDGYYNSGYYNNGWYDDEDYRFPDEYYYEYPNDYYRDEYYQNYYTDYQRSIEMVNWNAFFRNHRLNRWQIEMILDLNNQFNSFATWNSYYRMNPNRWYYDRFYALERILGANLFSIYINVYYNGVAPVRFYTNRWREVYQPRYMTYYVLPRYRSVNVNVYRVNPNVYHRNVGSRYGWNQTKIVRNGNTNSVLNNGIRVNQYGTQNDQSTRVGNRVVQNQTQNQRVGNNSAVMSNNHRSVNNNRVEVNNTSQTMRSGTNTAYPSSNVQNNTNRASSVQNSNNGSTMRKSSSGGMRTGNSLR